MKTKEKRKKIHVRRGRIISPPHLALFTRLVVCPMLLAGPNLFSMRKKKCLGDGNVFKEVRKIQDLG
jgi:hypothetical protein